MRIIANKYASTLEDKKTDRTSTTQKEKTWKAIEDEFNASSSCSTYRNATCLKKCYENRKKKLRKALAEERKQTMLTGGGPPPKIIRGLDNPYDDDADESPINFNEKVNDEYDDVVVEYIDERDGAIAEKPLPLIFSSIYPRIVRKIPLHLQYKQNTRTSEVSLSGSDPKWKKYTPQHLQLPISAALTATEPKAASNNKTPKKDEMRDNIPLNIGRDDLITRQDNNLNIKTSFNISIQEGIRHKDDGVSVELWVEEVRSSASTLNPVLLYKKQNEIIDDYNLENNNFQVTAKAFMSDITNVYYNAWEKIIGPCEFKLFCSWDVDRAWQQNLQKVKDSEKRNSVSCSEMSDCRTLSSEFLREFIELYKELPFITKINSLRGGFRREHKKVVDSKRSGLRAGEVYVPSLWCYDLLLFALKIFAPGSYQLDVGSNWCLGVSQSSVSRCITEVTDALNNLAVFNTYVSFPQNTEQLQNIRRNFYEKYDFPGVVGCIDCTHIAIVPPVHDHPDYPEYLYVNRKGYHSINVIARYPGSTNDAFFWNSSNVQTLLRNLHQIGHRDYFLLGDSGYPLRTWLMTPLEYQPDPNSPHHIYNVIHKRVRTIIEHCNGLFKARFPCCLKDRVLHYTPEKACRIINACVVLHNLCILHNVHDPEPEDENADFGLYDALRAEFNVVDPLGRVNPELAEGRRKSRLKRISRALREIIVGYGNHRADWSAIIVESLLKNPSMKPILIDNSEKIK
ncbi:hypothetical protein NQ317_014739 [Molorchus minor]|uniref:Regulatory protein zeste n=1 Tax=Molorchus minor TaxID=1323400 RepID=A0ABQ9IZ61_9CUCU|nr:hypothetical protein NQ317_014739 [Molorchus minor]